MRSALRVIHEPFHPVRAAQSAFEILPMQFSILWRIRRDALKEVIHHLSEVFHFRRDAGIIRHFNRLTINDLEHTVILL